MKGKSSDIFYKTAAFKQEETFTDVKWWFNEVLQDLKTACYRMLPLEGSRL